MRIKFALHTKQSPVHCICIAINTTDAIIRCAKTYEFIKRDVISIEVINEVVASNSIEL